MPDLNNSYKPRATALQVLGVRLWPLAYLGLVGLILSPLVSICVISLSGKDNIWPHLLATVLPRYMINSAYLMVFVGLFAVVTGTVTAWLVTMYQFPAKRFFDFALLFPLAIPAYVSAYALVDFLDYAGPVQSLLRGLMGWQSAQDYWFFQTRSRGGAAFVMGMAFYPYVFLLARAAFREQSGSSYEVARALGLGPWRQFWRVGLPLARPAIAAGLALVMMETVADFGTVAHFGVQTLTTGIFNQWLVAGNAAGAAQIALMMLIVIAGLTYGEKRGRRHARYHRNSRAPKPVDAAQLKGSNAGLAFSICLAPFFFGFILPVAVMLFHSLGAPKNWMAKGLVQAIGNSFLVASTAASLTVLGALVLVYAIRLSGSPLARMVMPLMGLGYATPGAVLALGLLIPLAAFDNWLADWILVLTGHDPGLLLTGSAAAIILAFIVRFFGVAQGAVDGAFGRISPSLPMVARSLGQGAGGVLRSVYIPLMRGSVATAGILVFVDCVKELPATLLLRPFNFNTLATRAYEQASLEHLDTAAPAALIVVAFGLTAVGLLKRANLQ
jgi:iron(III) transport system permease protein